MNSKEQSLDQLLDNKLKANFNTDMHRKKFMGSDVPDHSRQLPIISSSKSSQVKLVLSETEAFLGNVCKLHQLKHFSISEVFFGVLSDQYVACEIARKFTL